LNGHWLLKHRRRDAAKITALHHEVNLQVPIQMQQMYVFAVNTPFPVLC